MVHSSREIIYIKGKVKYNKNTKNRLKNATPKNALNKKFAKQT